MRLLVALTPHRRSAVEMYRCDLVKVLEVILAYRLPRVGAQGCRITRLRIRWQGARRHRAEESTNKREANENE